MRSTVRSPVHSSRLPNYRSRRFTSRHPVLLIALLLTVAAVFVFVSRSSAAGGDIDPAFNAGGAGTNGTLLAVAVQADGKIVIGGDFTSYNGDAAASNYAMRLNADGTRDTTFNAGGLGMNDVVNAVAVQPDGKIVIGGSFTSYNGDAAASDKVMRLNADGTADTTFNAGGAGANSVNHIGVDAVAVQSDGKIVIGGDFTSYNGDAAASDDVMRLNADGTLDTTFNAGGAGADGTVRAVAVQPDGKIVIGGQFTSYNGDAAASDDVMRLNADGTRDTTFNAGGAGADSTVRAVAVQTDGKIVIGGLFTSYNGDAAASDKVMRLNADGTADTTFNAGGAGANNNVFGVAVQTDGKIVIGGNFTSYNGDAAASDRIMQLNADGTADTTFNAGGAGANSTVFAVAMQPDGKIVIVGAFTSYNGDAAAPDFVIRLLPTPSTKANQSITVGTHAPASATYNTSFTVAATASSTLAVSFSSAGVCTNVGATFTMTSGTGTCTVKYDQAGDANYNAAPQVTESVTAQKANQSITVSTHAPANATYNTSFTVAATADSSLAVAYSSAGVCTNVGATFTMTSGTGTCTVKYDQAGDPNYNAAPQVTDSVTAQKANQTITVNTHAPASATFNSNFTVAATSNSALAVAYSSAGVCTNVGAIFTMTNGIGTCTVKYDQAGNGNFNAATQVTESVTGQKAATATALSSSLNPSALGQSVTFTATVTSSAGALTGTAQFKIDGANSGSPVTLNGSGVATLSISSLTAGTHTVAADYSGDTNFAISTGTLSGGQVVNNRPLVSFSLSNYPVNESAGFVTITVNRTGDLSVPVTVDYATDDTGSSNVCSTLNSGMASSRCDFSLTLGTLRFAATETQKTFMIPITQDSYTEGPEVFTVNLSNLTGTGAAFATPSSATVTINDSASPAPNAIDDTTVFVRQQYRDFLNREADAPGLAFWKDNIDQCNDAARRPAGLTVAQCIEVMRINTSAAFFLSIEFQSSGGLVRSFYVAALNRPATNNMPAFVEFERDTQAVQSGVIVGPGNWQLTLNANRDAFMKDFATRTEFTGLYPTTDSPTIYVGKLYQHALSRTPTSTELQEGVGEFPSGATQATDPGGRGRALLRVTQASDFQSREMNRSFVQMEYFGYLRRNPNDAPDGNFAGYDFWLAKLNAAGGNFIQAEMVRAFLNSGEYRRRFGP